MSPKVITIEFNHRSESFAVSSNEDFLPLLKKLKTEFIIGEDQMIRMDFDSLVDGAKYRLKEPSITTLAPNTNVPTTANASSVGCIGGVTRGVEAATLSDQENHQDSANATDESNGAEVEMNDVFIIEKVKVYHHRDKAAILFATGELKLQEFKSDPSKKRMFMQDSLNGFLRLNVAISKGMSFKKHEQRKGRIDFGGVREEEHGFEPLTITCKEDFVDELHSKLEEMAS